MTEAGRNMWVGLFVVGGLASLALLMVWFGEAPSWLGGNEWTLHITDVRELRGVSEGSPVNMNGVGIGRVSELLFENADRPDQGVVIETKIKKDYVVCAGSFAKVYGATLGIGTGKIEIVVEPGRRCDPLPQSPEDGLAQIPGEMRSMVGEIISRDMLDSFRRTVDHIGDLTAQWAPVGTNLARILEQRSVEEVSVPGGPPANLYTVVERLDELVANVNDVLGDENVQGDVRDVVNDLKGASTQLRETIAIWQRESQKVADNVNTGVDRTLENLERSFANLNVALERIDDSARSMAVTMNRIEQGQGTAGLFANDPRLYEAGVLMLTRIADAAGTLGRVLNKIEEDGYVTVGQAPSGVLRRNFPIESERR